MASHQMYTDHDAVNLWVLSIPKRQEAEETVNLVMALACD